MPPGAIAAEPAGNVGPMTNTAPASTLIEFPGAARPPRPQWRKELSERVREIQERRAREAALEAEEAARRILEQPPAEEIMAPPLGLVRSPDAPPVNPLVAAALRRIERARQPPSAPRARTGGGAAAAAVARVAEESYKHEIEPAAKPVETAPAQPVKTEHAPPERHAEAARIHSLAIVPPAPQITEDEPAASKPQPKRVIAGVIDDTLLTQLDARILPEPVSPAECLDDRASLSARFVAAVVDIWVVLFAASPFAAIIELTNGNWSDMRVVASMVGIVVLVMFLYLVASTALAGRTWGMSLVSLRAVDVNTGSWPTNKQCVGRAIAYIASLATFGLGILYALLDAEGRTAHDHLSGTVVVNE